MRRVVLVVTRQIRCKGYEMPLYITGFYLIVRSSPWVYTKNRSGR